MLTIKDIDDLPGVEIAIGEITCGLSRELGCSSIIIHNLVSSNSWAVIADPNNVFAKANVAVQNNYGVGIGGKLPSYNSTPYWTPSFIPDGAKLIGLIKKALLSREILEEQFGILKKKLSISYNLIIASGICNNDRGQPVESAGPVLYGRGSIADFMSYLVAQGEYVIATPLLTNPSHLEPRMFSLRRGWFWMPNPSNQGSFHIADTEYATKQPDKFLKLHEWLGKYKHLPTDFDPKSLRG